jgi:transcriptional regulator with XRE-family HTH domain
MELVVAINVVLTKLMSKHKISQHELSDALDIPHSTLRDWAKGIHSPLDPLQVKKLASFFDVSLEYMYFGNLSEQDDMKSTIKKLEFEKAMRELEEKNQVEMFG